MTLRLASYVYGQALPKILCYAKQIEFISRHPPLDSERTYGDVLANQ
jgi:hypothetical protein